MINILITGATGNVGKAVVKHLSKKEDEIRIWVGLRDLHRMPTDWEGMGVKAVHFDFLDIESVRKALEGCDVLFLLRPPQLSDVKRYIKPIVEAAVQKRTRHIVFLSVQGAEKSTFIPHYKIEKLIESSGIGYTFLRPAYFMQNFLTTLREDILTHKRVLLPAGKAKFTLVDVDDVGAVAAVVLCDFQTHLNQAYALTNSEQLTFAEMTQKMSDVWGTPISYESPNLLSFFWQKKKQQVDSTFIFVMIMLHYLPRFQPTPPTSRCIYELLGHMPRRFEDFLLEHKHTLDL